MLHRSMQLIIVIASSILTLISTDILLPSFPQIAAHYGASPQTVKMILSIFMIGQFATALFWGMIADQFGRKRTLFWGMIIFLIGSLLSLIASSITILLTARFLQGAGSIVVPVAGWALIQDLFPKDEGARILNWVGSLVAILPLFAPAIGGVVDVYYGWKTNLYCIAIYSTLLSLIMLFFPKQPISIQRQPALSIKKRLGIYVQIIKNRTFISYIALFGLLNSGEWCFLTIAPFYYSQHHIAPHHMGFLLMTTSMGFVLGSLLATHLMKRIGIDKTINAGVQMGLVSSLLLILGDFLHWSDVQIFNAMDVGLYIFSSALLWGGTTSRALQCFDECRGSASAVRSLILLCFSSMGTYTGQFINHDDLSYVGMFLFFMAFCTLLVFNNKELKAERLAMDPAI